VLTAIKGNLSKEVQDIKKKKILPWSSGLGRRLMTNRSWVQTPTMEAIFQAPFIWIKDWNKNCGKL